MAFVDSLLTVLIIVSLILIVMARITGQTITEMVSDVIDLIREKKEESIEPYLG